MDYTPTLADLPQQQYTPSLNDINEVHQSNFLSTIGQDLSQGGRELGVGLLNTAQGLANLPGRTLSPWRQILSPSTKVDPSGKALPNDYLTPSTNISTSDFEQKLGVENPGIAGKLMEGIGSFLPYTFGGEALGARGILGQALEGSTYGTTQSDSPLSGAIEGFGGGLAGGIAGKGLGYIGSKALSIPGAIKNYFENKNTVDYAPQFIGNLLSTAQNKSNIPQTLKDFVQSAYKSNKNTADQMAQPLNDSKIRFDTNGNSPDFPNYSSAANDLLAQRENLVNLFGNSSDLGSRVNKEVEFADNFLNNKEDFGVSFNDVWGRIKRIGDLASDSYSAGQKNAGRMLSNLKDGLSDDLQSNLKNSGNEELSNQLSNFNQFYRDRVVPFWKDTVISKSAQDSKFIPQSDALAKALFKPSLDNNSVLGELNADQKNVAIAQLLSKGKNQDILPDTLAKNWGNLTDDVKSKIGLHNQDAYSYLSSLNNIFGQKTGFGAPGIARHALNVIPGGSHLSLLASMLGSIPSKGMSQIPSQYVNRAVSPLIQSQVSNYIGGEK